MELGAASINIELTNGAITVRHGECGTVLAELKDAPSGTWDDIWAALEALGLERIYGPKS